MQSPAMTTPPPSLQADFGQQMKLARKARGLSQRDLAKLVGVNPETINRVERGFNTRVETMTRIQDVLPDIVLHTSPDAMQLASVERRLRAAEDARAHLAAIQARVIQLVQMISSIERMQKLQDHTLRAFTADLESLKHTRPVATVLTHTPAKTRKGRARS